MSTGTFGKRSIGRAACAEVAAAAFALVTAALLMSTSPAGSLASLAAIAMIPLTLAWIMVSDLITWSIPDGPVIAVAILGAAWRLGPITADALSFADILTVITDGAIWGGAFLLLRETYFRRRGFDGLGFGDVKLAFACAILLGATGFAWALLLSSLAGLFAALVSHARGRKIEKVPFGAFLAPACGLIWLAGLGR